MPDRILPQMLVIRNRDIIAQLEKMSWWENDQRSDILIIRVSAKYTILTRVR